MHGPLQGPDASVRAIGGWRFFACSTWNRHLFPISST
jgi:hypothetical protein